MSYIKIKIKEASTLQLNEANQLKEWKKERNNLKEKKRLLNLCLKDTRDALIFKNTKLTKTNLVDTLNKLKSLSKKDQPIKKEQLKKITKYNNEELNELIERLKMLGEIYDPYLETKKQGKYIQLI